MLQSTDEHVSAPTGGVWGGSRVTHTTTIPVNVDAWTLHLFPKWGQSAGGLRSGGGPINRAKAHLRLFTTKLQPGAPRKGGGTTWWGRRVRASDPASHWPVRTRASGHLYLMFLEQRPTGKHEASALQVHYGGSPGVRICAAKPPFIRPILGGSITGTQARPAPLVEK